MRAWTHVALAVPDWNRVTYENILRSLFAARIINGPDLDKLRSALIKKIGVKSALLCSSGTAALEIALRACGVGRGDEVIIPTFCCTSVVFPALAVEALPVLADMGEDLNITAETVEASITEKTKAIVVPHLFGNPADIRAIMDLACGRNIRVIDDAAQALGAVVESRPVGSFGDAGVLSFGWEKVCSGIGGGVVGFRNRETVIGSLKKDLPPPGAYATVSSLLSALIWHRWRRWTRPLQPLFNPGRSRHPDALLSSYRRETMANLNAAVASSLLERLTENIAGRRARVKAYRELLGAEERLTLIAHRAGSACLTQVVRIPPSRGGVDLAARVVEALGGAGYEIQGSYVPIHLFPPFHCWATRRLRRAEQVWADLVELPCEPEVSLDHVERIAAIVKRVLMH
jgi:dTDP-4-amino-4,6-dideoxygalactose transaminase